jgi:hypothetical protein
MDEVKMDIDMFSATMKGRVLGKTNGALIVAIEGRW